MNKIKICICTIGKKENLYVREYVNYYKNLGVDKIFIYDNNDKNDENFDLILKDFIDTGFVEIINIRGVLAPQVKAFEDCRKKNYKKYDWMMFFDIDEYIFLRNYSKVTDYLNQKIFEKCQKIQLNWYVHTDNNLIYYDNRSLIERFPEKKYESNGKKLGGSNLIKSILKGRINVKLTNIHTIDDKLVGCDGFGRIKNIKGIKTDKPDHYYYYIDHYWSKSTEEFVNKLMKGDVIYGYNNKNNNLKRIKIYFTYNNITEERINYIENKTKYNLTKYRLLIKK